MILYLDEELGQVWQESDVFQRVLELDGKVYRQARGRRTLQFDLQGRSYFLKLHLGVGWREIIKNLLQLRLPIISAANEWRAIQRLQELNIDTMTVVAYGRRGWSPASRQSFLVTRELLNTISLEDYCFNWHIEPPAFTIKRSLIEKVAEISRRLHQAGICHRDYYICHFLLESGWESARAPQSGRVEPRLYLIDLHRALIKGRLGRRWIEKDIAGLYFSSRETGLTRRDLFRFMRVYRGTSLRKTLERDREFWNRVQEKGDALYRKLGNPLRDPR
jgi:heptose I phosphotransferase